MYSVLLEESTIQSTLIISNSKGLSEILRDIRTSTYQICRIEKKIIRTPTFNKYICYWTLEVRDILKILWKRGEIFSSFPQYSFYLLLDSHVKAGTRFSLWNKRLFEIREVKITGVYVYLALTVQICTALFLYSTTLSKHEGLGPQLAYLSETAIAHLQKLCISFPILS